MAQRDRVGLRTSGRPERPGRPGVDRPRTEARPGAPDPTAYRSQLREVIAPVVEETGYDLEDLVVSRAGRRHVLRVVVDADGGVNLDQVAELSRDISAALDRAEEAGGEFVAGEYVLEVGSPGVDRPLTQPRHWRRNVGRLVTATAGDRRLTGRILAADDGLVTLDLNGRREVFGYPDLGPGRVRIEFSRPDDLGDDEYSDDEYSDDEYDDEFDDDEEREEDEE